MRQYAIIYMFLLNIGLKLKPHCKTLPLNYICFYYYGTLKVFKDAPPYFGPISEDMAAIYKISCACVCRDGLMIMTDYTEFYFVSKQIN